MTRSDDLYALPGDLPSPQDDGACDHLPGMPWPAIRLPATSGVMVSLADLRSDRVVVYFYPRTGLPDRDPPGGLALWNSIPGARGCTPQACGYRDQHAEFHRLGCSVFGVSAQNPSDPREAAERLHLPFNLLSDEHLELAHALRLPTFPVAGRTFIKRLTLVGSGRTIERCFYPVFPSDADAANVLSWITAVGR